MLKVDRAVIVEGKYDKIKLSSIIDAVIIETNGYGIFKDKDLQLLIRTLAEKKGLLILTDSDSAGFRIRNFILSIVDNKYVINAYIPDIFGKERRKAECSKEGKLGVEGVSEDVIVSALNDCGVLCEKAHKVSDTKITLPLFYELGLTGCENSDEKRRIIKQMYNLPQRLSTKSLITVLNCITTAQEFTGRVKLCE